MKHNKKNELDVDFIGGQEPLTKEEEKAISNYLNAKKIQTGKVISSRKKQAKKPERSIA